MIIGGINTCRCILISLSLGLIFLETYLSQSFKKNRLSKDQIWLSFYTSLSVDQFANISNHQLAQYGENTNFLFFFFFLNDVTKN